MTKAANGRDFRRGQIRSRGVKVRLMTVCLSELVTTVSRAGVGVASLTEEGHAAEVRPAVTGSRQGPRVVCGRGFRKSLLTVNRLQPGSK